MVTRLLNVVSKSGDLLRSLMFSKSECTYFAAATCVNSSLLTHLLPSTSSPVVRVHDLVERARYIGCPSIRLCILPTT